MNSPDPLSLSKGPVTGSHSRQPSTPTPRSRPLQQSPNINLRAAIVLPQKPASTIQSLRQREEEENLEKIDLYTLEQTIMEKEQELRKLREEWGRRSYDWLVLGYEGVEAYRLSHILLEYIRVLSYNPEVTEAIMIVLPFRDVFPIDYRWLSHRLITSC